MAELCLFDFRGKKVYSCKCHRYEMSQSWPKVQRAFLDYNAIVLLQKANTSMKYHPGNHLAEFEKEDKAQCFTTESCPYHLRESNMTDFLKVCYKSHCSGHGCSQQSKVSKKEEFVEYPLDGDILLSTSSKDGEKERILNVQRSVVGHKGKDSQRLERQSARDVLGIKGNLNNLGNHCNFIDLTVDESDCAMDSDETSEISNDSGDDYCSDEEGCDGIIGDLLAMSHPSRQQKRWLYLRRESLLDDVGNEVIIISDSDDEDCVSRQDVLNENVISVSSSTNMRNVNFDLVEVGDEDCGTEPFDENSGIESCKPLQSNECSLNYQSDECNESIASNESEEGALSHDTDGSYENEASYETDASGESEASNEIEACEKVYSSHDSEASNEGQSMDGHVRSESKPYHTKLSSSVSNEIGECNDASTYHSTMIEKCSISPCKVLLSPCYDRPKGKPIACPTTAKRNLTGYFCGKNEMIDSGTQSENEKSFELISSYMENDEEISLLSFSTEIERISESDEEPRCSEFSLSKVDHIQLTGLSPLTRSRRSTVLTENCESFEHEQSTSNYATFFGNSSEYGGISHFQNTRNICFKLLDDNTAEVEEKAGEIVLGVEKRNSKVLSDLNRGCIIPDGKRVNFDSSVNIERGNQKPESERKKVSRLWNNLPSSFIEGGCNAARKYSLDEEGLCDNGKYELIEEYVNSDFEEKERIALSNGSDKVEITNYLGNDLIKLIKDCYVLLSRLDLNGYGRFQNTFIVNSKRKRKSTLFFDAEAGRLWKKKKRKKPRKVIVNKQKKGKTKAKDLFEASLRKINQRIRNQNLLNSLLYWEEIFDLDNR